MATGLAHASTEGWLYSTNSSGGGLATSRGSLTIRPSFPSSYDYLGQYPQAGNNWLDRDTGDTLPAIVSGRSRWARRAISADPGAINILPITQPYFQLAAIHGDGAKATHRSWLPARDGFVDPTEAWQIPGAHTILAPLTDDGHAQRRTLWRPAGDGAEPVAATFIAGPLPPGALCWIEGQDHHVFLARRGVDQPRTAPYPTEVMPLLPPPLIGGGGSGSSWGAWDTQPDAPRRLRWKPGLVSDIVMGPHGVVVVTGGEIYQWDSSDIQRRRVMGNPITAAPDIVPIWTWGTGQPVPLLSWGEASSPWLRPQRQRDRSESGALPLISAGIADVPFVLIGWRDDTPPMRWRRPTWHVQEIAAALPLADVADLAGWNAAQVLVAQPDLVRARTWRSTAPEDMTALTWDRTDRSRGFEAWDSANPAIRTARRPVQTDPGTLDVQSWVQGAVTYDALGHVVWDMPPLTLRAARRLKGGAVISPPPLASSVILSVPWTPLYDDGSRAQGQRPTWRASVPDWAAPDWIEVGVILVAGPYYVCAAAVYVAGAVAGAIE